MSYLIFVDVETTGLHAEKHLLLEVAAVGCEFHSRYGVTRNLFEQSHVVDVIDYLGEGSALTGAAKLGQHLASEVDNFVATMHSTNGLFGDVFARRAKPIRVIEDQLVAAIRECGDKKNIMIAGNSIPSLDLPFLRRFMPKIFDVVHYHTVDVSSFVRQIAGLGFPLPPMPKGPGNHRALDDAKHSRDCYHAITNMLGAVADGVKAERRAAEVVAANSGTTAPTPSAPAPVKGVIL